MSDNEKWPMYQITTNEDATGRLQSTVTRVREPRIHDLKTWPVQFAAVVDGSKRFELRVNDRDYAVGDVLRLREWDPGKTHSNATGRTFDVRVSYLVQGTFGLPSTMCVMSVEPIGTRPRWDHS